MIVVAFRLMWRVLILALGIALLYLAFIPGFKYVHERVPFLVAALIVYCILAYIAIPALVRLFRLVIKPNHIPLYVSTADGWASDPVNIALIVQNKAHLRMSMKKAGWYESDPMTLKNAFMEVISIVFNKAYPAAPLSALYLFNRPQDIGFEIPTNGAMSARTRHHVRFWRLEVPLVNEKNAHHYSFWTHKLRNILGVDREIWIGAATEETHPIDIRWRTGQLTHGGSSDDDQERDFIIQSLKDAGQLSKVQESDPGEELRFRGQQFRTIYITDGGIKIARLKKKRRKIIAKKIDKIELAD